MFALIVLVVYVCNAFCFEFATTVRDLFMFYCLFG